MTGDGSVRFTVELEAAISTFSNTLGYYRVAADGTIGSVHVLFADTHNPGTTTIDLGTPGNGERIGFFLIQDGADLFANLPDNLSFLAAGAARPTSMPASRRAEQRDARQLRRKAAIFHSFQQLNPDRAQPGAVRRRRPAARELQIGFEDVAPGRPATTTTRTW